MGVERRIGSASAEDAKAALSSVLASPAFVRAPRVAHLLEYLCSKYFEGQTDGIKEYNIAVEVLGRPESFDPAEDAIARVEVHRLRRKLREHYQAEGAGSRLRIEIPTGSYAPTFVRHEPEPVREAPGPVLAGPEVLAPPEPIQQLSNGAHANAAVPVLPSPSAPLDTPRRRTGLYRAWAMTMLAVAILAIVWLISSRTRSAISPQAAGSARTSTPALPPLPAAAPPPAARAAASNETRILCGKTQPQTDHLGYVWGPDRDFDGGSSEEQHGSFLTRTLDPAMFQNARSGNFSYRIPLPRGLFELHLYFAETVYGPGASLGGGENSRVFNVTANGRLLLGAFDILSDAGGAWIADERVFKDIAPDEDGFLRLTFHSQRGPAMVNAIEIVPATAPHRQNPVRIYAQEKFYTDSKGLLWSPDNYWSGGQIAIDDVLVKGTRDPNLFSRGRYGHFSYAIPADRGDYAVSLYLAEEYWGGVDTTESGIGRREFDVYCNGIALLRNFDIYKEAGGLGHALIKTFHGLRPNAQGKLLLSFVPVKNYASVYAIEVVDETR